MMQANGTPYSSKTPVLSQMRWGVKMEVVTPMINQIIIDFVKKMGFVKIS